MVGSVPPPPPPPAAPLPAPPRSPGPDPRSDHDLLRALAAGDEAAFRALVERWRPRVVNFLTRRGADPEGAEDAAQETFVRIYGYRHAYRPDAPFTSFLFTVARNALLDAKRKATRRREQGEGSDGLPEPPAPAAPDVGSRLDLAAAVHALPPHLRAVVELAGLRGLPYQAVAVLLGIPEGTVKSRMFHALRQLREALDA